MAELATFQMHPGDAAPPFSLPGVDGKTWSLTDFTEDPFLVVTFWCNHCPYVQAWEGRVIALQKEFTSKGVRFVLINSNDATSFPDDRFEAMVARAKEKGYPFPYLRDETQHVAHAYGAMVTPHPMLFGPDRRLLFQGRIDDNHSDSHHVKHRFLYEALEAATAGRPVPEAELPVLGCSVKWRS
ncbi:MAG: thioredoxin family protein [Thermoplasmata archaeon]